MHTSKQETHEPALERSFSVCSQLAQRSVIRRERPSPTGATEWETDKRRPVCPVGPESRTRRSTSSLNCRSVITAASPWSRPPNLPAVLTCSDHVRLGQARYVATDALCERLEMLPRVNAHTRQHPQLSGLSSGRAAVFAETLPIAVLALFVDHPDRAAHDRSRRPQPFRRVSGQRGDAHHDLSLDVATAYVVSIGS